MEKMASDAELPWRETRGLRPEAVPDGALKGPPTCFHLEERGRRDTGVTEEGARTTTEAGVANPYRADSLALPLRRPAVPTHTPAVANHEAEVAAMQGASIPDPLPIFLNEHHHQVAVATLQGGTARHPPSISPWRTMLSLIHI